LKVELLPCYYEHKPGFAFLEDTTYLCQYFMTTMQETLESRVEAALDSIRPYLEADGGNVKVLEITRDNILRLEMLGNCGSCPMSAMTLKAGVEEAIKRAVPEIVAVVAVNAAVLDHI
jgi:Fe-S cluster biogenesis protein NfuA